MSLPRCRAVLDGRTPCGHDAPPGSPYCEKHRGPAKVAEALAPSEFFRRWSANLARLGRADRDKPEGWDAELVEALLPLSLPLYYWYWRVDVDGVENLPTEGPALLAANHSGAIPLDGAMLKVAVLKEHGRNPWLLAADLAFKIPGFRDLIRIAGNARADRNETLRLLREGELLGVFPEGFKGIGKGWAKRYQLQRFGRGGFVEVAIETGAPIIPVAIVGAEETYPMIANLRGLARRFGLPYLPVTPTFPLLGPIGAVPLPSKWIIAFGEPIPTVHLGPEAAQDTQLVLEMTEQIRNTVQGMIATSLGKRRHVFF